MAKKTTSKREFDWIKYSKPARALTENQLAALREGILAPALAAVDEPHGVRLEIRARQAVLYCRGANLLRVSGDDPFVFEVDTSFRLPAEKRTGEILERTEVVSAGEVEGAMAGFRTMCDKALIDPASDRARKQAIASANAGADLWNDECVIVDLEYTYGKRRYDLVALRRTPGITGPGGFASPRLAFVHVQAPGQTLTGNSSPAAVAADFAEFVKALGGEHLDRAREEIERLVDQKVYLGLLPDLDLRSLPAETPELLVIFTADDVSGEAVDRAVIDTHDRALARHFPTDRLRFAHLPGAPDGDLSALTLREGDVMSYRAFKEYRRRG